MKCNSTNPIGGFQTRQDLQPTSPRFNLFLLRWRILNVRQRMIVFLQFKQYITIYMYLHALEICDVQFSITHVQPDHGVWAQIHVNVITPFWIGILLLDLPDQFCMYIKNIVISYMSYLKKEYAPAKFLVHGIYVKARKRIKWGCSIYYSYPIQKAYIMTLKRRYKNISFK